MKTHQSLLVLSFLSINAWAAPGTLHCRTVHFEHGADFKGCRAGEFERPSIQARRTFCCHNGSALTDGTEGGDVFDEPVVIDSDDSEAQGDEAAPPAKG